MDVNTIGRRRRLLNKSPSVFMGWQYETAMLNDTLAAFDMRSSVSFPMRAWAPESMPKVRGYRKLPEDT